MLVDMIRLPAPLHASRPMWLLLSLVLLGASGVCSAGTRIHHCVATDGTPVFTDQPCASVGAVPIDRTTDPLSRRKTHHARHCPMDLDALKKRVTAVFQAGNANALAGLMLWRGYGARVAANKVQQLAELMQWPFLGLLHVDKRPGKTNNAMPPPTTSPWMPLPPLDPHASRMPAAADTVIVKLANPSRPRIAFHIVHRDGCLWLSPRQEP